MSTIEAPNEIMPNYLGGCGRVCTGLGKWMAVTASAVEDHLIGLGLAERYWTRALRHLAREGRHESICAG